MPSTLVPGNLPELNWAVTVRETDTQPNSVTSQAEALMASETPSMMMTTHSGKEAVSDTAEALTSSETPFMMMTTHPGKEEPGVSDMEYTIDSMVMTSPSGKVNANGALAICLIHALLNI